MRENSTYGMQEVDYALCSWITISVGTFCFPFLCNYKNPKYRHMV